uniref:Uncharacterized protein n=1 Tax=Arundo donax TaxID=35708 RepID=A0A0A8ZAP2_ARUDO
MTTIPDSSDFTAPWIPTLSSCWMSLTSDSRNPISGWSSD